MSALSKKRWRSRIVAVPVVAVTTAALLLVPAAPAAVGAIVTDPISTSAEDAALSMTPAGTYETGVFDESAAEIVTPYRDRLFVVNAQAGSVEVLDYSDPTAITKLYDIAAPGVANSVAIRSDGLGAIAFEAPVKTDPGFLLFFDANADSAAPLGQVTVGALPDMVSIASDGSYAVVANEGEPSDDFDVDPEGSIGVVRLTATGTLVAPAQSDVRIADFHAYENGNLPADVRVFGPTVGADYPVSRNLEPEYITVVGGTAYAALQEANAVATIDLKTATVTDIWSLGFKDHGVTGNGIDASDRDPRNAPTVNIRTYPGLYGVYMPDAMSSYSAGGQTYLVTANEGDAREWGDYAEPARVKDLGDDGYGPVCADSPLAGLTGDSDLGRLNVTRELGYDATAGCYDELYAFGARSFSIWTTDGTQVFDSGDQFEKITSAAAPGFFNSNHSESGPEGRSDDKGPEPESVTIGAIGDRTYAFIGFERVGGIAVFDITDPAASTFVTYVNNRDFAASVEDADDPSAVLSSAGDLGPEGLAFIPAASSPTGAPMLAVASEVSGTTTLFSITDLLVPANTMAPSISGTADIGTRLTAAPGTWTVGGARTLSYSYQWLRDGKPIAKATGETYRVSVADRGRAITVRVTATAGAASTSAESAPVTVRQPAVATVVASKLLATTRDSVAVTVRVHATGGASATGDVTVTVAGKTVTGTLVNGKAVVPVGKLPRGGYVITATYAGSASVAPTTGWGIVFVR